MARPKTAAPQPLPVQPAPVIAQPARKTLTIPMPSLPAIDFKSIAILILTAVLAYLGGGKLIPIPAPGPVPPAPSPLPGDVPDMAVVFAGQATSADDARAAAELFDALHGVIEFDAVAAAPRLATGAALEDFRNVTREYFLRGGSFDGRYPQFGATVGTFLDKRLVSRDPGPIDPVTRQAWLQSLADLSAACLAAETKLRGS